MMAYSKKLVDNQKLFLVLRITLGGIFLIAGIIKALNPDDYACIVVSYNILPHTLAWLYGYLLPWVEIVIGCTLLFGPLPGPASFLSIPLIAGSIYASSHNPLTVTETFGCFAQVIPLSHGQSLFINSVMLIMANLILLHRLESHRFISRLFTAVGDLRRGRRPGTGITIIHFALVILLVSPIISCGNGGDGKSDEVGTANQSNYGSPYKVTLNTAEDDWHLSFGVITDTHVDAENCSNSDTDRMRSNRAVIADLNRNCTENDCLGVVHMGDMVNINNTQYLVAFRQLYENDYPGDSGGAIAGCDDDNYDAYSQGVRIKFPVFPTVGNHDTPPYTCSDWDILKYDCKTGWNKAVEYVGDRTIGVEGISSYDATTYAWRWGNYYFIQLGLWAGSYEHENRETSQDKLLWLKNYLATNVGDSGNGVLIFQHYGWDSASTESRWWTDSQREQELAILRPYNILGIFTGHVHYPAKIPIGLNARYDIHIDNYSMGDSGNDTDSTGHSIVTLTGDRLIIDTHYLKKATSHYEKDIKVGSEWQQVRWPIQWSSTIGEEGLGWYTAGGGTAIADIDGNGKQDLLLMGIDAPYEGGNSFWYKIGWDIKADGTASSWSARIGEGGLGWYSAGGGAAIADINGNGKQDLLLMGIDDPYEAGNAFWYRIGWDIKADGTASSWSARMGEGGLGWYNAGGGAAIADINGNGELDLLLMGIDDRNGPNSFWYKIGWDLDTEGNPISWSDFIAKSNLGGTTAGGGATIADIDGNGQLDLLLMTIDDPSEWNTFWFTIGWDLDTDGTPTTWSDFTYKGGLGYWNAGGGATIADINGNGELDLLLMGIDDPDDSNEFWLTIGWDLSELWR